MTERIEDPESDNARLARLRRATEHLPSVGLANRISDAVLQSAWKPFPEALVQAAWRSLPLAFGAAVLLAWLSQGSQHRIDQLLMLRALEGLP